MEAAGAGILQRIPITHIGQHLADAAAQLATISALIPQLHESAELSGQRLGFCAEQMTKAGHELQGVVPDKPKGKSWLKGGM